MFERRRKKNRERTNEQTATSTLCIALLRYKRNNDSVSIQYHHVTQAQKISFFVCFQKYLLLAKSNVYSQ